jgi:hypothetical protein
LDPRRLESIERLQRLRESGALSEDEFHAEKRAVLAVGEHGGRPRRIYFIAGAIVLTLLAATWAIRGQGGFQQNMIAPEVATESSEVVPTVNEAVLVRTPAETLADAFEAATGHRASFSEVDAGEEITTTPIRIIQLPFGTALLTKREVKDGCHACAGSIGVYYLKGSADGMLVTGHWPKAVEGWGWGAAPATWYITDAFTEYPAVYASGAFMGQGVVEESATITELRPQGPVTSGVIGTGFSDEGAIVDSDRPACVVKGAIANVRKNRGFDVVFTGSVKGVDHSVKKGGKFVAGSKLDWGLPCDNYASDGVANDLASVARH